MHAFLSIALVTTLGSTNVAQHFDLRTGDLAPPFTMKTTTGESFSLKDKTGKAVVVMVFFATWCEPCKKEVPIIQRAHTYWKERNVAIVHVGQKEKPEVLAPFAAELGITWPVVPDPFGLLSRRYGADQLPHIVIIGKDGKIAWQHRGIAENLEDELNAKIAAAAGEPPLADAATLVMAAPQAPSAPVAAAAQADKKTYWLGRPPWKDDALMGWQPLTAYLEKQVQANVELTTEANYKAYQKALDAGKYDIANAGPVMAYRARKQYQPVAQIIRVGELKYYGILFGMRKGNRPARSLADLRGKKIAMVAPDSASGGVFPMLKFLDAGLIPGKDVKIVWKGTHAAVVDAVQRRKVAAGACFQDCRDLAWPTASNRFTVIIDTTEGIPPEVLMVRRTLPEAEKQALIAAILSMSPNQGADADAARALLAQISGEKPITDVLPVADADMAMVESALNRLGEAGVDAWN